MARLTPQWLQAGNYAGGQDRRLVGALWPAGGVTGCAVSPATGMAVNIAPGQVAVPTQNNTGSTLCTSTAVETLTLDPAPPSGTNRWDLIVCQPRSSELDGGANEDFIFAIVKGAQATPPATVPAVPAGTLVLAQVGITGGMASITPANITDRRPGTLAGGQLAVPSGRIWPSIQTVLAGGVTGLIDMAATDYLLGGMVRSGSALYVPVAGVYHVAASIAWQSSGGQVGPSNTTFTLVYKNGAIVRQWFGATNWTAWLEVSGADDIQCGAGDYLQVYGQHAVGGGGAGSFVLKDRSYLSAHLVSTGP